MIEGLYILLYLSSLDKYFQIVDYSVRQAWGRFKASTTFDSHGRADSNETVPDSAEHLPPEISDFFILLTFIAMRTLQNLYHLIPLEQRTPTPTVAMLSHRWLKRYPNLCT